MQGFKYVPFIVLSVFRLVDRQTDRQAREIKNAIGFTYGAYKKLKYAIHQIFCIRSKLV